MPYHHQSSQAVLDELQTSPAGLSDNEATERQKKYGPNALPVNPPPGFWYIFLLQFKNPLIYILLIAAVISLLLQEMLDAAFIGLILLITVIIGAVQEWKAEQNAASLQQLLKIMATVRRNNSKSSVEATELVPGDVVLLESGNRVPADLRLLEAHQLKIDESLLTGESEAIVKNTDTVEEKVPLGDRKNMAFAGSTVMAGRGVGVVTGTGTKTEIGRIGESVAEAGSAKPPLIIRLERLSKQIAVVMLFATAAVAAVAYMQGMGWKDIFFMAVALIVSAIPEGLPFAITVALSIATLRMSRRNVIVRRLSAVEGLGSCTFIASDKTGTLTVNKQTVKKIILPDNAAFDVAGEGYNNEGEIEGDNYDTYKPLIRHLAESAVICNEGTLKNKDGKWKAQGDAMDIALLAMGYKAGLDPEEFKNEIEVLEEVPYESERKYAATFYRCKGEKRLAIKGALETILPLCTTMQTPDGPKPADADAIEKQATSLTEAGYRVLAVATATLSDADQPLNEESIKDLQLQGLTGFIDPLRPEVTDAIAACAQAGVTVAIVTGDHPLTALAIARELKIAKDLEQVITGIDLEEAGDPKSEEFKKLVQGKRVFARVSPIQKLHITDALQRSGHYVAVTGDGVNDVPALKKANIGIAMGSGTDLAKETAEIIVTDDNFASIEAGIEGGRFAYDNIRKVTYLLISTGASEIFLFILSVLAGLPMPLTAIQLLWLNLVTNGFQDKALAFEAGEPEAMKRPPRKPTEGIFNPLMIKQVVTAGLSIGTIAFGLWYYLMSKGYDEFYSRNLLLMLMVLIENIQTLNARSEYKSVFKVPFRNNPLIILAILAAQGIHILAMHIPIMQEVLQVQAVSMQEWLYMLGIALSMLVIMETFKWIQRRRMKKES